MQIKKMYSDTIRLKKFLDKINIKYAYFALPIFLSFGAALFDGVSIGLLLPMAKGVIQMDFGFVRDLPFFKEIIFAFPDIFINTNKPNSSIFVLLLGIIFVSTVIKNILLYFSTLTTSYQARQFSKNTRNFLLSRYLSFGKLFFDRSNIGYLNTVALGFTTELAALLSSFRNLVGAIFTLIIYLVVMCIISWKLTIFALLLFPALYYSINWLFEKIKATSRSFAKAKIDQSWRFFDILTCIPLVKAYSMEKAEDKDFARLSDSVARFEFSNDKKMLLISPMQELIIVMMLLFIVSVMSFMFVKSYVGAVSSFLVFFYILRKCTPLFGSVNSFKADVAKMEGPVESIIEILNDEGKFFIPDGNITFEELKGKIEFKNLNFSYIEKVPVLRDVSFSIEKGKMTAIVGPTGSGKTTLISLIMRFYDCPSSSIFIDGVDMRNLKAESLRKHIGLVSQETMLFNNTVRYNITYGIRRDVSEEKLIEVTKKARLYDFVKSLPEKFDTLIGDKGVKLSGGEKQRLPIARMFLKGAEILILDEATSSLDSKTEHLIQEAINEAVKDKTSIVIAHRLSTIKNADKIVVIEKGKIVEQGTLEGLLDKKGIFWRYWEEQKFD